MSARLAILISALAATAALTSTAPASANDWRKCGDQPQLGAGWYNVRAHNISCRKARAVAKEYGFAANTTPFGFACQDRLIGYETTKAACRRNRDGLIQKVRFEYGA